MLQLENPYPTKHKQKPQEIRLHAVKSEFFNGRKLRGGCAQQVRDLGKLVSRATQGSLLHAEFIVQLKDVIVGVESRYHEELYMFFNDVYKVPFAWIIIHSAFQLCVSQTFTLPGLDCWFLITYFGSIDSPV